MNLNSFLIKTLPPNFYSQIRYLKNSLIIRMTGGKIFKQTKLLQAAKNTKYEALFQNSLQNFSLIVKNFKNEFNFPLGFVYNGQFESVDFEIYYSVIRKYKPDLIIEIGSGHSTHLAVKALKKNRKGKVIVIDPSPQRDLPEVDHIKGKVENADLKIFRQLKKNDILFIDSSHTAKEANYHIKKILPNLKSGVLVHHHDIFYPYKAKYGEEKVILNYYSKSNIYVVLLGSSWMHYYAREKILKLVPSFKYNLNRTSGSVWTFKI
ncbi:MAG TPA: class I SAM-dependent methyltransferase [Patescibacteria group bacterium]